MHNRLAPLLIVLAGFTLVFFISRCSKFDTTNVGGDLIPEVDNINTFADTLDIITTQGIFEGSLRDTTRLTQGDAFALGKMNDPLMGGTDAQLFLQFKPSFYPYYIGKIANDTITGIDSVVLCLDYQGFWGDSSVPIELQVQEVATDVSNSWDSVNSQLLNGTIFNNINFRPVLAPGDISAPKTIDVRELGNWVKISKGKDSVRNQIRIKLSDQFRDKLFGLDTSSTGNKGFLNDSIFRTRINGFAIRANSGNGLIYTGLYNQNLTGLDQQTRLEMHFKKKNGGPIDTVFSSMSFIPEFSGAGLRPSSVANQITRTRNPLTPGDQELALQTNPGTFATLEIPSLGTIDNRVIHRAELQVSQIPSANPMEDLVFSEPEYMYLDLLDSTPARQWKPVYIDLSPGDVYNPDARQGSNQFYFPPNGVDFAYYGGNLKRKIDGTSYYNFNITRHAQQIVTNRRFNYKFRLMTPHSFIYTQCDTPLNPVFNGRTKHFQIGYPNSIAFGRVRVGGGANPDPRYRMRLRIIYSKIK